MTPFYLFSEFKEKSVKKKKKNILRGTTPSPEIKTNKEIIESNP